MTNGPGGLPPQGPGEGRGVRRGHDQVEGQDQAGQPPRVRRRLNFGAGSVNQAGGQEVASTGLPSAVFVTRAQLANRLTAELTALPDRLWQLKAEDFPNRANFLLFVELRKKASDWESLERFIEEGIQDATGGRVTLETLAESSNDSSVPQESIDILKNFSEDLSRSLHALFRGFVLDAEQNVDFRAVRFLVGLSDKFVKRTLAAVKSESPEQHLKALEWMGEALLHQPGFAFEAPLGEEIPFHAYAALLANLTEEEGRGLGECLGRWLCQNLTMWTSDKLAAIRNTGPFLEDSPVRQGFVTGMEVSSHELIQALVYENWSGRAQAQLLLDWVVRELTPNRLSDLEPRLQLWALTGVINAAAGYPEAPVSPSLEPLLELCNQCLSWFVAPIQERWLDSVRVTVLGDACLWSLAQDHMSRILANPNRSSELLQTMGRLVFHLFVPNRGMRGDYVPPFSEIQLFALLQALDEADLLLPVLNVARNPSRVGSLYWEQEENSCLYEMRTQIEERAAAVEETRARMLELKRFKEIPTAEGRQIAMQDLAPRMTRWIEDLEAVQNHEISWEAFCTEHDDWERVGVLREYVEALLRENPDDEDPLWLLVRSLEARREALGIIQNLLVDESLPAGQDVALDDHIREVLGEQNDLEEKHDLLVKANNMATRPFEETKQEFENLKARITEGVLEPVAASITDDETAQLIASLQRWSAALEEAYPSLFAHAAHQAKLSVFDARLIESLHGILGVPLEGDGPLSPEWLSRQWEAIPNATGFQQVVALYAEAKALATRVEAKNRSILLERIRQRQGLLQDQPPMEVEVDHWSLLAAAGINLQNVRKLNLDGFQDFEARLGIVGVADLNVIGVGDAQLRLLPATRILQDLLPETAATRRLLAVPHKRYRDEKHGKELRLLWEEGKLELGEGDQTAIIQAFEDFAAATHSTEFARAFKEARGTTGLEFFQKAVELFVGFSYRQLISRFALQFDDNVDRWWEKIKTEHQISSMSELAQLRGWTDEGNFYRLREIAAEEI